MTAHRDHTFRQIMKNDTTGDPWQQNDGSRHPLYMECIDLCVITVAGEQIHDTVVKIRYRDFP